MAQNQNQRPEKKLGYTTSPIFAELQDHFGEDQVSVVRNTKGFTVVVDRQRCLCSALCLVPGGKLTIYFNDARKQVDRDKFDEVMHKLSDTIKNM